MSIPIGNIKTAIYNWIKNELSNTEVGQGSIVWFDQNAPRPPAPYISMQWIQGPAILHHDEFRQTAPGVYDVTGQRTFSVTFTCYGKDADEIIGQLHSSLEKQTVRDALSAAGVTMVRQSEILEASSALETKVETRRQFDVQFRAVSVTEDNVGFIESVELENEILGETQVIDSTP